MNALRHLKQQVVPQGYCAMLLHKQGTLPSITPFPTPAEEGDMNQYLLPISLLAQETFLHLLTRLLFFPLLCSVLFKFLPWHALYFSKL